MTEELSKEETEAFLKSLIDPKWRIRNLYYITDKDGNKVLFKPNKIQEELDNDPHPKKLIVKARQEGVTTYACIKKLDNMLFKKNYEGDLLADTLPNAKKIFKKIKFAWDYLPQILSCQYIVHVCSETAMTISLVSTPQEKRTVTVSVTTRSSTSQDLHISELGRICSKFPEREEEIKSGALESVGMNQKITIESTAMGKYGLLWNLTDKTLKQGDPKSPLDWKLFFFPWWINKDYNDPAKIEVPKHLIDYFAGLLQMGITLTEEQKNWYVRKESTLGWTIKREYPSHILEAFEGQTEGSVYLNELGAMLRDGRYKEFEYNPNIPVFTFWDLGWADFTCITFFQGVHGDIRVIDYMEGSRLAYSHFVKIIQDKPYTYGGHFLPHDARKHSQQSGKSDDVIIKELGLKNVTVLDPTPIATGIQNVRQIFPNLMINKATASLFYDRLNAYRYQWNDRLNQYDEYPIHDINSHGADTLRTMAANVDKLHTSFASEEQRASSLEETRSIESHLQSIQDMAG